MGKPYRIAIIGVGAIADIHARAIADLPNASLVAGNCRTKTRGEAFASKWNCEWYADVEAMLDEAKPDLVTIATPSGAHLEPVQICAKHGIHALCEKPLEITTDRIDRMIKAAGAGNIQLGGFFPQRYNPVIQTLRDAIGQGRFGKLAAISVTVPWWRDDAYYAPERWQGKLTLDGGGAFMNQSIHYIDLLQWLGAASMPDLSAQVNPIEEVFCFAGKLGHDPSLIEVEDTTVAVARFRNGALANMLGATSMYPGSHRRILVAGRDGTAETVGDLLTTWHFREARSEDNAIREKFRAQATEGEGASDPMAIGHGNHTANLRDFLAALDGGRPPTIDAPEARKAVAIIEACYASAASGRKTRPAPIGVAG